MKRTAISPRSAATMLGVLCCLGAYQADQLLRTAAATSMTVSGGTPAARPAQLDSLQQLYPLLATPQIQQQAQADGTGDTPPVPQTLDQLFGRAARAAKPDGKLKAQEPVDYFAALNQSKAKNVRLDGLAPGVGAVINGIFIAVGDPIPSLEYPADAEQKKMVVPRLTTVAPAGITIREPNGSRSIVVTIAQ